LPVIASFIAETPALRRATAIGISIALISAAAELIAAMALVQLLASLSGDPAQQVQVLGWTPSPTLALIIFLCAASTRSLSTWAAGTHTQAATQIMAVTLQSRLYGALTRSKWSAVRRETPAVIANALHTQSYEASYGFGYVVQLFSCAALVLGYSGAIAVIEPALLAPVFALAILVGWAGMRRGTRMIELAARYRDSQAELHRQFDDWIAIARVSHFGADTAALARHFGTEARNAAVHATAVARSGASTRVAYELAVIAAVGIGVPVAWSISNPTIVLALSLVAIARLLPLVGSTHVAYHNLAASSIPVQYVLDLEEKLDRASSTPLTDSVPLQWQTLELVGVGVGVGNDSLEAATPWILRDVNLKVRRGEWVGITGATGSGKTSLAEVLLALVQPDLGTVSIDGNDLTGALAARWMNQAAYVPQEVSLFDGTILENLLLCAPEATQAEIDRATELAAADSFIARLPDGLNHRVGPGGRWLSGGERQRLGIARALLRAPQFLVLDEPTASLDDATQATLIERLGRLRGELTAVIVSHRSEVAVLYDRAVGMSEGHLSIGSQTSAAEAFTAR